MREITLEATLDNVPKVTDFINEQLDNAGCPMKAQMQIDVAIDEMFGNIAHYAYEDGTGNATVQIEIQKDPSSASITFVDSGVPYDPLKKDDPDVTLSLEERQIGGLGIFIVKKTMDDIKYEYKNGKNILTIHKKF